MFDLHQNEMTLANDAEPRVQTGIGLVVYRFLPNAWIIKKQATILQRWIGIMETGLLREGRARAAMARPVSEDDAIKVIKDKPAANADCGASSTLTGSLVHASDIEEKVGKIDLAASGLHDHASFGSAGPRKRSDAPD